MKRIKLLAVLTAAIVMLAGCGEKKGPEAGETDGEVAGTWKMVSWSNTSAAEVYVEFAADGSFDLYQRVFSPFYEHFEGTWSADGKTISGKYSDGKPWASTYDATFYKDGEEMQLTRTGSPEDVSVFVRGEIPGDILSGELGVKSESESNSSSFRFL